MIIKITFSNLLHGSGLLMSEDYMSSRESGGRRGTIL